MSSHQAEPDAIERDGLVMEHGYLVEREAARYRTWHIDRADLRQAGILGLLIATARFDPDRAVLVAAYAHTWVRKEILHPATVTALHRQLHIAATEDDEELPVPGYTLTDPEHAAIAQDFIGVARSAPARMDPRQADALILRYGLDDRPARSYRQIGRPLGVSDHTARNLVERAQADLRLLLTCSHLFSPVLT